LWTLTVAAIEDAIMLQVFAADLGCCYGPFRWLWQPTQIATGNWLLLAAVTGAMTGCGEANALGRRAIHGKVSYQGEPVDYGSIQFSPDDTQHGVSSGAMIEDGKYQIELSQGLPPGLYHVMISSPDRNKHEKVEGPPGDERSLAVERIPKKYNLQSTLQIEVQKGRGSHEANFELK
jgi:hypothetical protein